MPLDLCVDVKYDEILTLVGPFRSGNKHPTPLLQDPLMAVQVSLSAGAWTQGEDATNSVVLDQ